MNFTQPPGAPLVLDEYSTTSLFGYKPDLGANVLFLVLFALISVVHIVQVFIYREWWVVILPIGTLAEMAGYIPRLLGRDEEKLLDQEKMRDIYVATMCLLIITPCLFAAVHFTTIGRISTLFPRKYVIIPPKYIMPLFVSIDVASLIVQGIGAGTAATAETDEDAVPGSHITVAGVAVQLFGYLVFMFCFLTFAWAVWKDPPTGIKRYKPILIATFVSSLCIILRSIFRLVEMGVGWTGEIARTEWCLFAFDSSFVWLGCAILNVWNPGRYLPKNFSWNYKPENDPDSPFYQGSSQEQDPESFTEKNDLPTKEFDGSNDNHSDEFYDAPQPK